MFDAPAYTIQGLCPNSYNHLSVCKAVGGLRLVLEAEKIRGFAFIHFSDVLYDFYICNSILVWGVRLCGEVA